MSTHPLHTLADSLAAAGQPGPAAVWRHFHTLCVTPRQSKHEAALRAQLLEWAQAHGIATTVDNAGNLILRKPATPGCEAAPGVILQGHLDMVCQADSGVNHDFACDPVPLDEQNGWIVAAQTTLGADNGIGVALALAVLERDDLRHGPLEVLLTVDEEDGMGGAHGLAPGSLQGHCLINLDTEEWGEFYIGCAGGLDVNVTRTLADESIPAGYRPLRLRVAGLLGGHSGADIHLGRGNANKLLLRLLCTLAAQADLCLVSLHGGTARNAIPREAEALVAVPAHVLGLIYGLVEQLAEEFRAELAGADDGVSVSCAQADLPEGASCLANHEQRAVLAALNAAPVGVRRMCVQTPGVVETSNNLGTLRIDASGLHCNLMVRSLIDSAARALGDELAGLFALAGCTVELAGQYPGWQPNPDSVLLRRCRSVFAREFGATCGESRVQVIHAGLECGLIGAVYPHLDMVSFGPTIRGAHAPGERVEIASVGYCWQLLTAILAELAGG